MDKLPRDRGGEIFQDDLTENQSKERGSRRDDIAGSETMDPGVDSQEDDRDMEDDLFGVNEPKKP
ncbi:MAG TPA: hypothetical protein VFW34_10040 [Candidatus Rubrimentiphilum sp.]|nr:hypothetical protein [Candidatus Rubrimentiphilum sp.]